METQEHKRFFNYRPMLSICLFFIAGIVCVVNFYIGGIFNIIVAVTAGLCFLATFIVKLILAKSHKVFKLVSIVCAFVVSVSLSVIFIEVYKAKPKLDGEYLINARVCERTYYSEKGKLVVTVEDIYVINYQTLEKNTVKGKMRLYLNEVDGYSLDYKLGEEITGNIDLMSLDLFSKERNNFALFNRKIYTLGFGSEEDVVSKGKINPTIIEKVKNKVKASLEDNLSADYSELAYTMLFGDKSGLSEEIRESYSSSGIGHLLAVSGLHVGFIVTLLAFVLKRLKANRIVIFWVIVGIVFIYALLCGFTVSVTRAIIMTIVMLYARLRLFQYDSLSSLSVACLIILIMNPFWIFDVGFQLSFLAVLAIIILSPVFERFFNKIFHKKLSKSLAVCLSAQIGVLPVMFKTFSTFSIFSIITNMICIPIASIAFMILFVTVILSLIIPQLGVLIYAFEFLMKIVTFISGFMGAIELLKVKKWTISLFSASLLAGGIFVSDYVFFKGKARKMLVISSVAMVFVTFVLIFII